MPVIVVGVDHRNTPAEVVERLVAGSDDLFEVADALLRNGDAAEVVTLGTCLRSELYVETLHPARVVDSVERALFPGSSGGSGMAFAVDGPEVLTHLFRVSAGLQSTVLGETEILGQVARCWETARTKGTSGPVLDGLFRHAISAGKQARTNTRIGQGVTSIAHAAVIMAKREVFDLHGKRILVVGAGDMSERMALAAQKADGVAQIVVANRTWERARALAERVEGVAVEFGDVAAMLPEVDVVFTSTGAATPIITKEMASLAGSLLIIDFAVPRDTEVGVEDLENVDVLLMHDLEEFAQAGADARAGEVEAVERIVADEIRRYSAWELERTVAPVIAKMRNRAEMVRMEEIGRYASKLQGLDHVQREAVEAMTKTMMNKLFHEPTMRLKETAGTEEGEELAEIYRQVFDS